MREELFNKANQLLEQLGGGQKRLTDLTSNTSGNKYTDTSQIYDVSGGGVPSTLKNSTDYEYYKLYKKYKRKYKHLISN